MTILALPSLSPRDAVADALQRCILGLDTNDRDLFGSGCLMNESMILAIGPTTVNGWKAICDTMEPAFRVVTSHVISNIRINLEDGADTASMTAHAMSYHIKPEDALKPEDTSYTASSLYDIDLVKDKEDGLWKIKRWGFQILWTTGDRAVLVDEEDKRT